MTNEKQLVDYLKRMTTDLRSAHRRIRQLEDARSEPIAIVGMACRYPGGVTTPGQLWELVRDGRDAVSAMPDDRGWDVAGRHAPGSDRRGTFTTAEGAFLDDAAGFDPGFFGLSPREALAMDPQHRLLLEVSWEAVENAGLPAESLRGSRTGVFGGLMYHDYAGDPATVPDELEGYLSTGVAGSVLSGRVSYVLGLEGPSVTVDTACSSSLVSLHLAVQSLRDGECDLALAGGVTVMSTPGVFVEMSRQGGLATDGRCKSYAEGADGTGWGEGVGVLVVERLSDARRLGHQVLAVVRGSAVNQDGASNGLTAPNGPSQQRVIRAALENAGLQPSDVDVVEGHGTGTSLGDPIEAQALLATYGQERETPLLLGSIKSNIGHTQAAAGVAGIIKMVSALRHGVVPASLHAEVPSSQVDWSSGAVELAAERRDWPRADRVRRAAVSSFGISGTNAHVILEAPEESEVPAAAGFTGPVPLVVSGRGPAGVRAQVDRLTGFLAGEPVLADVAWSLVSSRARLDHGAVVRQDGSFVAESLVEGGLGWMFTGQGAQRLGMGEQLRETYPVFAATWDEITAYFPDTAGDIDRTGVAQLLLFAFEVSLARLLESWGVRPEVVIGHSIGELAAACVAGLWSVPDACRIVAARASLMQALPSGGVMWTVGTSEAEVADLLGDGVSLAAVNGPSSVVLSGDAEPVDRAVEALQQKGVWVRQLRVSHAFHSPLMAPMLEEFRKVVESVEFREPTLPLMPTGGGRTDVTNPGYWVAQVTGTVRFTVPDLGTWLEVGPASVLSTMVDGVPAVKGPQTEAADLMETVGRLWLRGHDVDWAAVLPGRRRLDLPTYAFQHRHYWLAAAKPTPLLPASHPLLSGSLSLAGAPAHLHTGHLSPADQPWLADHRLAGTPIVPGTAFAELALHAGARDGFGTLAELVLHEPLALPGDGGVDLQLTVTPGVQGTATVAVHARADVDLPWTLHASGSLTAEQPPSPSPATAWPPPGAEPLAVEDLYDTGHGGVEYGVAFQGLRTAWRLGDTVFAEVALPPGTPQGTFGLHPALFDAALHAVVFLDRTSVPRVPFSWNGVSLTARGADALRVRVSPTGPDAFSLVATDPGDHPVFQVESLTLREIAAATPDPLRDALFETVWRPLTEPPTTTERSWTTVPHYAVAELRDVPDVVFATIAIDAAAGSVAATHQAVTEVAELCRTWLTDDRFAGALLVPVLPGATDTDPVLAACWGFLGAAQAENPGRIVLADAQPDDLAALVPVLDADEPRLAVRDATVLVPRLAAVTAEPSEPDLGDGKVLVTGGTGALGAVLARHLVTHRGVRRLLLTNRGGPYEPRATALLAELRALGADVDVVACDLADPTAVAALAVPELTAVLHLAGTLDDGLATSLTPERIARVLTPKVDGAWHLHEATKHLGLRAFVLFSSASGLLGGAGQAAYAAANAYLDALAARIGAQSLAWGAWAAGGGMAASVSPLATRRMARAGLREIGDAQGAALFDAALSLGTTGLAPVALDRARLRKSAADGSLPPILRDLAPKPARATTTSLATSLGSLSEADAERQLLDVVRTTAASVLGHRGAADVEAQRSFQELGFDSLVAVEFRTALGTALGRRLPATLVFDHPTPSALARHLLAGSATPEPVAPTAPKVTDDPIVVVGLGCRFPGGVHNPGQLWDLVTGGTDAISEMPANRGWDLGDLYDPVPGTAGKSYTRHGGFLHDADEFDAEFFGISPREAAAMDPQQRLLLEVAWETLEHARVAPDSLRGTRTGVFAGVMYNDYGSWLHDPSSETGGYGGLGTAGSVLSGRVAYVLGLEGPAVSIDTACSSSLVSLHLAAQALRAGECDLALAGGVTVMSTPATFVDFSRQGGLSADGRCRSYGAGANGTGWGEGAGLVLLERLSNAQRRGHEVLAVVRGSAINSDGASNGLTAPNGPSQQRVIRAALAGAGLSTADVQAVEGHGTGTTLGDPIEVQALLATYGQDRAEPLWLGSVKSNLGHTQAAAGIAGVLKMILAMRHGTLPATLHADEPSARIDWDSGAVRLLTEARPWPAGPRRAAVSAFGVSGTNAHVVLEGAPVEPPAEPEESPLPVAGVLSGHTPEAVLAQAGTLAAHLRARPELTAADVLYTLGTGRSPLRHRMPLTAPGRDDLLAELAALSIDDVVAAGEPRTAFVFTGQGAQRLGMGRGLYEAFPVFARALDEVCDHLDQYLAKPVRPVLFGDYGAPLDRTVFTQTATFAVEVALVRLLESWGLRPDAVAGHSVGELAAAHVASVLDLADACALVAARGQLMEALPEGGAMIAIAAPEAEVVPLLGPGASLAAVNAPDAVVVSGDEDAVTAVADQLAAAGTRVRRLRVSHAFHSARMDPMLTEFTALAASLTFHAPRLPIVSSVTGTALDAAAWADPAYWARQVRDTVRFADVHETLRADGIGLCLEVGPDASLTASAPGDLPHVALLRREQDETACLLRAVATAHAHGTAIDWEGVFAGRSARRVELPTYAFQRARYWLPCSAAGAGARGGGLAPLGHPLLGTSVTLADGEVVFAGTLSAATLPWLVEHTVGGTPLLPGSAFVELVTHAADHVGAGVVEELLLQAPLRLPAGSTVDIQVRVGAPEDDGWRAVSVHSRPTGGGWVRHASATVYDAETTTEAPDWARTWPPAAEALDVTSLYPALEAAGYGYGPTFRCLRAAWRRGDDVFADLALPEAATDQAGAYGLHPALLDAALHGLALAAKEEDGVRLPYAWTGVRLAATGASAARVRLSPVGDGWRVELADPAGHPVVTADSLVLRATTPEPAPAGDSPLFRVDWTTAVPAGEPRRLVVTGEDPFGLDTGHGEDIAVLCVRGEPGDTAAAAHAIAARVLAAIQSPSDGELTVVTRGAIAAGPHEDVPDLAASVVWGLVRSAQSEHAGKFTLVDIDDDPASLALLPRVLGQGEPQLALRAGIAYAPRLAGADSAGALVPPAGPWRLDSTGGGTLDAVTLVPFPEAHRALGPHEVRVSVRAAGLNFRDVMVALAIVPGLDGIGGELAGDVLEVGAEVRDLAPGDRVMGLCPAAFAPVAVTDHRWLTRLPAGWTYEQGAAVPVAFLTAYYGLVDLADLRPGESVLVHAAAGGVGTAAVQLAGVLGAEVYATASPAKQDTLRARGIPADRIANSRTLGFEPEFLAATGGAGLDVVLDCLSGEFVDASLRLLPRGGRFLEMGKTDIRDADEVAAEYPGVRYRVYDVQDAGPDRTREMLDTLSAYFADGSLTPQPITVYDVRRAPDAFRALSQAALIGKAVLTLPRTPDPAGTVLITGGTGALGGLLARHLVERHGATRLVLTNRRGPDAPDARELAERLGELGADVTVAACDVADRAAVEALLGSIPAAHPLTAVVHAAGRLDDGVVATMTEAQLHRVLAAKVDGAWHLHELTRDLDLASFTLFSSAAGLFGNAGQANYAAGNTFLDALAQHRRATGRPGQSVAWGAWTAAGGMAGTLDDAAVRRMARGGFAPITEETGLALFDAAAARDLPLAAAVPLDTRRRPAADEVVPPLLRGLLKTAVRRAAAAAEDSGTGESLRDRLGGLPAEDGVRLLTDLVRTGAARVLGHPSAASVPADRAFNDLGFDSLTSVEFRNHLNRQTGLRLPSTLVFDHPTPELLAAHLRAELAPAEVSALDAGLTALGQAEALLAAVPAGEADRERVTRRLRALLAGWTDDPAEPGFADAGTDDLFAMIDQGYAGP
ncbi:SDR family NAD(P)-dependent oxidoreductase [Amycolatopsis sp. cmx-4-68]|uniref:SDR family NAD(P)-dependent oxidoreductase n=1 Tax=Amycolatopsis sp. cmx-4-68 TaxID=2790938 RepID=UPI0039785343